MCPICYSLNYPKCGPAIKNGVSGLFSGFGKLTRLWLFSFLMVFAAPAAAAPDDCRPEGMSDAEAAQIIAIATEQGKSFRAAIDAMRADGVRYETDTTYDDLMADPERAIALAKERHFGRVSSVYSNTPETLHSLGTTLDELFENSQNLWVQKQNVNYYTTELISRLEKFIRLLGGKPTESPYRYKIGANTFVFALGYFTRSAKLKYLWGRGPVIGKYISVNYMFSEEWALRNRRPNFGIGIQLTTNLAGENITLDGINFRRVEFTNGWPILKRGNKGCLVTFIQTEE